MAVIPRHRVSPFGEPDDRLRRGIQYAAASRLNHRRLWNTGSPAFAGDDEWWVLPALLIRISNNPFPCVRIPAAQSARVMPATPALPQRGRRECRAPGAPAAACAGVEVESTRVSQVTPRTPGIPHAMVYGLLRALPGDRALLPPSPRAVSCARLDASVEASGPHDFAVRFRCSRQERHPRPPHPASRP
jgi:hypothetical protein